MSTEQHQALRDLEASILGAILIRPETLVELPRLETDDFLDLRHRAVFSAMRNLEAANTPIDVITVEAELSKAAEGGGSVDVSFLGTLALNVPTAENALEYARQVREASLSRKVTGALDGVLAQGKREVLTGGELLSAALASLSRIDEDQPDDATSISALVSRRLKQLEMIAGSQEMTGFPTGVAALDEKIGGVQPGIVTIVAARPAMGKSALGLSIADGSSSAGFGVHLFSLEDTEEAYADRTLSRGSEVPAEAIRNAKMERGQLDKVTWAISKLRGRRWLVDGRSGITADEIVRSVRRHRRANETRVVIVDYIQLVKRPPRMSPHEALGEIITTLADAAKADRMAYVVMSQLSRSIESRQDKRPQLQDLRESGSLEERSKCVVGLYRGAYYGEPIRDIDWNPEWKSHNHEPDPDEHAAQVQLCVIKNSNGRTGVAWGHWHGPTTKLS